MLTLILLVVLGGGVGVIAVWLIEPRGLSRLRLARGSLRLTRSRATSPAFEPATVLAAGARRRTDRIPAAYTAVEGTYREVARPPLWRRALSLVALVAILVVIGVAIAAVAGATLGIVAELVDGAVG